MSKCPNICMPIMKKKQNGLVHSLRLCNWTVMKFENFKITICYCVNQAISIVSDCKLGQFTSASYIQQSFPANVPAVALLCTAHLISVLVQLQTSSCPEFCHHMFRDIYLHLIYSELSICISDAQRHLFNSQAHSSYSLFNFVSAMTRPLVIHLFRQSDQYHN